MMDKAKVIAAAVRPYLARVSDDTFVAGEVLQALADRGFDVDSPNVSKSEGL